MLLLLASAQVSPGQTQLFVSPLPTPGYHGVGAHPRFRAQLSFPTQSPFVNCHAGRLGMA